MGDGKMFPRLTPKGSTACVKSRTAALGICSIISCEVNEQMDNGTDSNGNNQLQPVRSTYMKAENKKNQGGFTHKAQ